MTVCPNCNHSNGRAWCEACYTLTSHYKLPQLWYTVQTDATSAVRCGFNLRSTSAARNQLLGLTFLWNAGLSAS